MQEIVKRINGNIHTSGCNLKCGYCYLAQANYKNKGMIKALRYPLETILAACSRERLGGTCIIEIIGDGETLLPDDVVPLILGLLKEGHYVLVINNGTLKTRIHELVEQSERDQTLCRLIFSFSLHFLELEKRNLLTTFADNINFVKKKGISFGVSLVCADEYVEAADRIHRFCEEDLGGVTPNISPARECDNSGNTVGILSKYDKDTYYQNIKKAFPTFNTESIYDIEHTDNHQFCYAGSWCFQVDFTTGMYSQCLRNAGPKYNFFENIEQELMLEPVGTGCRAPYCWCGWTKTMNLIPGKSKYEPVDALINAPEYKFMDIKSLSASRVNLADANKEYTETEKELSRQRSIRYEYFARQVELLKFDFVEEKYEKFIQGAEVLLEEDLDPRLWDVVWLVVRYGYALLRTGQAQRALDLASCYEDLNYNADYCYVMGLAYMNNGMIEQAEQSFYEAARRNFVIDKGANSEWPYLNLGLIYESRGDMEKAKACYLECGSYEPAIQQLEGLR